MKRAYTIQENGQITLPAEWREKYGLKKGDEVSFEETDAGLLISPKRVLAARLLDELAEALKAKGVTLEELLASNDALRETLVEERPPNSTAE